MSQIGSGSNFNYLNYDNESKEKIQEMIRQNNLLKSMLAENTDIDLKNYLSNNEKETLNKLNDVSNKLTEQSGFIKDIMNQPLQQIIHNWSSVHQDILNDTVDLFKKSNIIEEIKNNKQWWNPIIGFFKRFINIISMDKRMFYVGITIIFVGLIFVFINVTS